MYCEKCGMELREKSTFCGKCGTRIGSTVNHKTDDKNKKTYFLMVPILVALGILAVVWIILGHKTTIDMKKYIEISCIGYDGFGEATIVFDEEKFYEDHSNLKINKKKLKKHRNLKSPIGFSYADRYDEEEGVDLLSYHMMNNMGTLDREDQLSNGDTVTFTWDLPGKEDLEDVLKCRIETPDISVTIQGLQYVETFDPYELIEVSFHGSSPEGNVYINELENNMGLIFRAGQYDHLANGDVVTVTVSSIYHSDTDYIERYGKMPSVTSKDYTVTGLDSYITSADQIPDSCLEQLKKESEDLIRASIKDKNTGDSGKCLKIKGNGLNYCGNYVLTSKFGNASDTNLFMVYQIGYDISYNNSDDIEVHEETENYCYVAFEAPTIETGANGDVVSAERAYVTGDTVEYVAEDTVGKINVYNLHFYLPGYADMNELYETAVMKHLDSYNCETNL